jgi:hypothetical protein
MHSRPTEYMDSYTSPPPLVEDEADVKEILKEVYSDVALCHQEELSKTSIRTGHKEKVVVVVVAVVVVEGGRRIGRNQQDLVVDGLMDGASGRDGTRLDLSNSKH